MSKVTCKNIKGEQGEKNVKFWNVFKFKLLSTRNRPLHTKKVLCEPFGDRKAKTDGKYPKENGKII